MKQQEEYLQDLKEIRSIMERSAKFISLNGLSGVFAGLFALIGAAIAFIYIENRYQLFDNSVQVHPVDAADYVQLLTFLLVDAISVLILAVGVSVFLTVKKAKRKGLSIWDNTAKRVLTNMGIPLLTGGILCLLLIFHGLVILVAPLTLIFYGLALVNTSKYTVDEIRTLGILDIILGLASAFILGYGFYFWVVGFGVLHIIYGAVLYYKYEREEK